MPLSTMKPNDSYLGPLFTRVAFRCRAPVTQVGEVVAVCGELPEFGGWDPTQALRLHTTPDTYPIWQSETVLIGTYVSQVQYKYVVVAADGSLAAGTRWEEIQANRQFAPVGEELSIVDEWGVADPRAGVSHLASPDLAGMDPSGRFEGSNGSLDLPPSLADAARRTRAPMLAEPLDGTERVLMVVHRLPLLLSRDDATGAWSATWDEASMWATSVDGGRHVLGSLGCAAVFLGSPGRHVPREEQAAVTALLETFNCYPVYIDPWELNESYQQYTKSVLWPLLHNELPMTSLSGAAMTPAPTPAPSPALGDGTALAAGGGGSPAQSTHYRRSKEQWGAYQVVNTLFANEVKARLRRRDLVWLHGHHLLLVPERIFREARQHGAPIGLFVHTPFPSSSIFSALPQRKAVLESMLHASIIGFHLYEYARNFMISARRLLGLVEPTRGTQHMSSGMLGLEVNSREVVVSVSHVGVEPAIVHSRANCDEVRGFVERLRADLNIGDRLVIGGVEWLSSMQGAALKLMAFESLLENYEKWRGRVAMVQVTVPVQNRADHSEEVAAECRVIARRIHARFGRDCLHYLEVGASPDDQSDAVALSASDWCVNMRIAVWALLDVLVVSATRDGLNLLPFEYVCARHARGDGGVCVLSEFAGCSRVLNGAIRVNPFSLTSIVEAIDRALSLDRRDSAARMSKDVSFVGAHTMTSWVNLFVKDLKRVVLADAERHAAAAGAGAEEEAAEAGDEDDGPVAKGGPRPAQALLPRRLDVEPLVRAYRRASRRVICFGLDGTLIPQDTVITHLKENHDFVGRGQAPSPAVLHCLRTLAMDPANDVTVLSGRGASDMHAILGSIDRLGLAAELGYLRRPAAASAAGSAAWDRHASATDNAQWRQEAKSVMHWYTTRTNGSYSRWQESAAVWCYHDADPDFGRFQGVQLHKQLVQQLAAYPVSVVHSPSKCTVEVRIRAVNKGVTTDAILCQANNRQADFVLCCGDDHSDEFMFAAAIARARAPLAPAGPGGVKAAAPVPSRRTFNITVGRKQSRATLYVEDTRQVLFLLQALTQHALAL